MHHNKVKKLKKIPQHKIVDLPDNGPMTGVDFVAHLDFLLRDKKKKPIKVLNKEGQMSASWIKDELPYWQQIWTKRGIKIRWDRRQRSFFLSTIKIK